MQKQKHNGFVKLDKVLHQQAKKHNLNDILLQTQVIKHWEEVGKGFLEEKSSLTKALRFNSGVLVVACLTQEVAYQVKVLAHRIIEALNSLFSFPVVRSIYIEV